MEGSAVSIIKEAEDEWKVVRPRKGKPHVKRLSHNIADDGHLSCCPGHGPNSNFSSRDADGELILRLRLEKSMERVRSSIFFKKVLEQMQDLHILEKLLTNARKAGTLLLDQTFVKENFVGVPNVGSNSVDHEASTFHFSDGTCAHQTVLLFLLSTLALHCIYGLGF